MDTHNLSLLAGSAKVDITPGMGIQLAGDIGRWRPAEWVEDRLYARALALVRDNVEAVSGLGQTGESKHLHWQ